MKNNTPTTSSNTPLTYKDAGVDIEAGNELVTRIKSSAQQTLRPEVLTGLGGFGGLFKVPKGYDEPVLVSGTDGVGTKLRLALDLNQHSTVGIDLVAMCVNDIIVSGAEPLYFLDYFATSNLDVERAADVIQGIAKGCELAGCTLLGGETAEMPGMYMAEDYDLAGFCVGIVEQKDIIDGSKIKPGHKIIGLKSSGPHSNGFSLIRKIIDIGHTELHTLLGERSLGEHLIEPTRIYASSILKLLKHVDVLGLAHITGGGLLENIPRVLPKDTKAIIDSNTWNWQKIFYWLQHHGNVAEEEMYRTFNCGIGMAVIVSEDHVEPALTLLKEAGESAVVIGEISQRTGQEPQVDIIGKK